MAAKDADLMHRWTTGDDLAFEQLVTQWQPAVTRLLGRLVGHSETAADLSQEVFLRVYQARNRYAENGAFSSWLYKIALNVARDHSRRRLTVSLPEQDSLAAGSDPAWDSMNRETAVMLREALADLPAQQREVLVLRHSENMNFEQISRLLDVPASTLKSRFSTALRRLRVTLRDLADGEEGGHP
mgnify:FL=1